MCIFMKPIPKSTDNDHSWSLLHAISHQRLTVDNNWRLEWLQSCFIILAFFNFSIFVMVLMVISIHNMKAFDWRLIWLQQISLSSLSAYASLFLGRNCMQTICTTFIFFYLRQTSKNHYCSLAGQFSCLITTAFWILS